MWVGSGVLITRRPQARPTRKKKTHLVIHLGPNHRIERIAPAILACEQYTYNTQKYMGLAPHTAWGQSSSSRSRSGCPPAPAWRSVPAWRARRRRRAPVGRSCFIIIGVWGVCWSGGADTDVYTHKAMHRTPIHIHTHIHIIYSIFTWRAPRALRPGS